MHSADGNFLGGKSLTPFLNLLQSFLCVGVSMPVPVPVSCVSFSSLFFY